MLYQTPNLMPKVGSQAFASALPNTERLMVLDPHRKSIHGERFEADLQARVVGQERAIRKLISLYQIFHSGLTNPTRPIGTMLFLGPTGSGKTHVVEAAAEVLFGDRNAVVKIDCAEFQHSHEIAKLIGSPPGYLGHLETPPLLTQDHLDKYRTDRDPFTLVLFDEIEKASDALWQLLLGVLDKATLTLGNNQRANFSQTIIFMTSNLGAREMSNLINGSIGFAPTGTDGLLPEQLDKKTYLTAIEAARRKFSPEFMNRIDHVVVFRSLKDEHLRRIVDLELEEVQRRIDDGACERFTIAATDAAKEFLLAEGTDYKYGARHLKRAIERLVVYPLANLASSRQVRLGEVIVMDLDRNRNELVFFRDDDELAFASAALRAMDRPRTGQAASIAA
jgi:ATP-dependent Clp protease ATP-binding subunit ClpA